MQALIAGVAVLIAFLTAASADVGSSSDCGDGLGWTSECSVSNTGSAVEVGATRPGGGGANDTRNGGGNGRTGTGDDADGDATPGVPCTTGSLMCDRMPITYTVEVVRQPTLADIASFAPASLPLVDEPDGVGLVGMPVNFVVAAQTHTVTGELFDQPVTVRFTPASFAFHYGDGAARETTTGGATWSQLGQAQFSATPTSHAYPARGTYSASAVVRYAADVDFGGGWVAVPGLLEISTGAMSIQILEVRTALVDKSCVENPAGIGC